MKVKTALNVSGRRRGWRASACALMALAATLLLVPAASAAPASGGKSNRGGQFQYVQLQLSFIE